mgnify:CR=1 FL=1
MRLFTALFRPRAAAAGAALLHPAFALALAVLVLNDHWLKATWPGVLSGKLSDFAVVPLLALFLHGLVELTYARLRRPLGIAPGNHWLALCIAVASLVFALPEVWHPAELAYRYGLGALRYPFRAAWALAQAHPAPPLSPVRATADLTDLLALPMALVAWRVGRRVEARGGASARRQASGVSHSSW